MRSYYEGVLEAERLVDGSVDFESRLAVQVNRGYSAWCMGRMPEALREIEEVGALAGGDLHAGVEGFGFSAAIWTDHMAGWALAYLGRLDESRERIVLALRRARASDFKENLGWVLGIPAYLAWLRGAPITELPEPRTAALEALEIAEGMASRYSRSAAVHNLTQAHLATSNFEDAARSANEGLLLVREHETGREMEVSLLSYRAQALSALGDPAPAIPLAREAVVLAAAQPNFRLGVEACCALAQALVASEGPKARVEIEATLAQAFAWLDESGAEALRPRVLETRAALAAALGDDAAQAGDLAEALRLYRAMGAEGHVARLVGSA
jgi:tetratricopeptide (TPR) repeat protein